MNRAIILAAGKGTRMKSDLPKVCHKVLGKPMINHVIDNVKAAGVNEIYVVVGYKKEEVINLLPNGIQTVEQVEQLGTGHAVLMCEELIGDKEGKTIVLAGDAPLCNKYKSCTR
jgi:bifunctional UDP-N-acetylglucosamine pyrophosphorylase/glucosamine-1-phosphate N-acetyltransferase